jgi:predicted RND superfamily exporter protein
MLSNILVQYRYFFFAAVMIAVAGSLYFIPRLQFESDFSQFLPKGDPELGFYEEFKKRRATTNACWPSASRRTGRYSTRFF